MATAKWATPGSLSSSLVTTELDSLANAAESALFTYDNSSSLDLYAAVTIKLGSITPSTGGEITLRVLHYDGTNTPDKQGGDLYTVTLLSGTGAKVVTIPMIRLYPFSMRLSIVNNAGVELNAADNDVYLRTYNEAIA
jgi:hypothetical protein